MTYNPLSEVVFELNFTIRIKLGHQSDSNSSFVRMEELHYCMFTAKGKGLASKDLMPRRMKVWNLELGEVISLFELTQWRFTGNFYQVLDCANVL
ncbi:hypothetical protein MTR_4g025380 [Medicago truncatula]|uniref:Uncharacterized protein n=1 Tax=Medicago truncatula TaxID=3880 RepID=A0A072UJ20_MEDTR|nr:hypothetical protein MTR_4g025380 [Medicago truncatula]